VTAASAYWAKAVVNEANETIADAMAIKAFAVGTIADAVRMNASAKLIRTFAKQRRKQAFCS
jgi:hypothetical protein